MSRGYRHIQEYEKEIMELRAQGKTGREIREKFGFSKKQYENFINRYNSLFYFDFSNDSSPYHESVCRFCLPFIYFSSRYSTVNASSAEFCTRYRTASPAASVTSILSVLSQSTLCLPVVRLTS